MSVHCFHTSQSNLLGATDDTDTNCFRNDLRSVSALSCPIGSSKNLLAGRRDEFGRCETLAKPDMLGGFSAYLKMLLIT